MPCAYALSAKANPAISISKCLYFDPNSDGIEPWIQLKNNGNFDKIIDKHYGQVFGEMACGIAAKTTVKAGDLTTAEMSLVWDMPAVQFLNKEKKYNRYYTKFFGSENAVAKIVQYAFHNYESWEQAIFKWQSEVLDNE